MGWSCLRPGALVLVCVAAWAQPSPLGPVSGRTGLPLRDDIVIQLIQTSSGDLAHEDVTTLFTKPRVGGTPEYDWAVDWTARRAREVGLEQVRVERFPADGKTEYLGQRPAAAWQVSKAELWMYSPQLVWLTT